MAKLIHFEIPSTDYARSKEFYEALLGWQVEVIPAMNYAMINIEGGVGGGFSSEFKPAAEHGIGLYFEVDDIPATLAKAVKLGGKQVMPKTAIGDGKMGYYGELRDPDGNLIGVWSKA